MTKEIATTEAMLLSLKETNPALYRELQEAYVQDFEVLGHTPRLPQIKISHGNKLFIFPNEDTVKELNGVVVSVGSFKELYDNTTDERKAPICASVNSPSGNKYGLCATCPHWKWGSGEGGRGRECSESRRIVLSVKGHPTPFELKVSTTAAVAFDKAMTTAATAAGVPVFLLNFSAQLTVEGGGSQKYSLLQPTFKAVEGLNAAIIESRMKLRREYANYCTDVYGKMNMTGTTDDQKNIVDQTAVDNSASMSTSTPQTKAKMKAKTKATKDKAKDDAISDAQIVDGSEEMDEVPF